MGSPTCRVGDIGSHGNVALSGSSNVLTNSRQTHRRTDIVVCPEHKVGVTLANCSTKVITNNLGTAHIGSISFCSPPSVLATGSPNVNVGG